MVTERLPRDVLRREVADEWILPAMADVTGGELDESTRIIDSMWEMASRGHERQADHAAGMLLSGSALQAVAPGEILDLVNRAIQIGYMAEH